MALTASQMLPLGTKAPNFALLDVISQQVCSLNELKSNIATVIMFICNHCPYVKHLQTELVDLALRYQAQNIAFIAINSNDIESYPADSPEEMRSEAKKFAYPFPYLFDETQQTAKAYQAACTPDFYIFDKNLACVYRGQFDDSRPGQQPATGSSITQALDCILRGEEVSGEQKPSMGCNIKWKK
jgi:peroxiredoxin